MRYKFRAKDIKTGRVIEGDLAYVHQYYWRTRTTKVIPMIVSHGASGGMLYVLSRHRIDESTIELVGEETV